MPWLLLLLLPRSGAFVTRSSALKGRRWRPDAEATMIDPSRPGTISGGALGASALSRLPSRSTTLLLRELSIGPPKSVDHCGGQDVDQIPEPRVHNPAGMLAARMWHPGLTSFSPVSGSSAVTKPSRVTKTRALPPLLWVTTCRSPSAT